jgi:hypothetical protein
MPNTAPKRDDCSICEAALVFAVLLDLDELLEPVPLAFAEFDEEPLASTTLQSSVSS